MNITQTKALAMTSAMPHQHAMQAQAARLWQTERVPTELWLRIGGEARSLDGFRRFFWWGVLEHRFSPLDLYRAFWNVIETNEAGGRCAWIYTECKAYRWISPLVGGPCCRNFKVMRKRSAVLFFLSSDHFSFSCAPIMSSSIIDLLMERRFLLSIFAQWTEWRFFFLADFLLFRRVILFFHIFATTQCHTPL